MRIFAYFFKETKN